VQIASCFNPFEAVSTLNIYDNVYNYDLVCSLTGDNNHILKLDLAVMINKQIFQLPDCPEIFVVQIPNIASVHGRLITLHQEPNAPLEEASTVFTVTLHGEIHNEVEVRKNYRVSMRMKTELKDVDRDTNMKCLTEEENIYEEGMFSHIAKLLSSNDVEEVTDIVKLKYTISLRKSMESLT